VIPIRRANIFRESTKEAQRPSVKLIIDRKRLKFTPQWAKEEKNRPLNEPDEWPEGEQDRYSAR